MPAITNFRDGSPCLSSTAHRFPQRLESDHHVYWRQWHLWLLHRQCEHPHILALIFIGTIKPFDIQTDNLSNNKTCKSQYFSSWCCFFFCTFSEKKTQTFSFFTDLFLAQEHSRSYPGSPGHPPQRGAFSLLCSVVKPHRHSHKHTPRHGVNVLFSVIQVPRAIVNLVELMNIVPLRELHSNKTLGCPTWFVKWVSLRSFANRQRVVQFVKSFGVFALQFGLPLRTEA